MNIIKTLLTKMSYFDQSQPSQAITSQSEMDKIDMAKRYPSTADFYLEISDNNAQIYNEIQKLLDSASTLPFELSILEFEIASLINKYCKSKMYLAPMKQFSEEQLSKNNVVEDDMVPPDHIEPASDESGGIDIPARSYGPNLQECEDILKIVEKKLVTPNDSQETFVFECSLEENCLEDVNADVPQNVD